MWRGLVCWSYNAFATYVPVPAGGDRLCHHMEVSIMCAKRGQLSRGVLFRGVNKQRTASRHRHEDDSCWQEHEVQDHFQGHISWAIQECLQRTCAGVHLPADSASIAPHRQIAYSMHAASALLPSMFCFVGATECRRRSQLQPV
jgi:hypothetical protein